MTRILGIDPGSQRTGIGLVCRALCVLAVLAAGVLGACARQLPKAEEPSLEYLQQDGTPMSFSLRPIYKPTAAYGHFGRTSADGVENPFTWEQTTKVEALQAAVRG